MSKGFDHCSYESVSERVIKNKEITVNLRFSMILMPVCNSYRFIFLAAVKVSLSWSLFFLRDAFTFVLLKHHLKISRDGLEQKLFHLSSNLDLTVLMEGHVGTLFS